MFTVKHVTPIGNEALYSANEVAYSKGVALTSDAPGVLFLHRGKDVPLEELRSGTAYVMNEHGSTVGTYRLAEDFGTIEKNTGAHNFGQFSQGQKSYLDNQLVGAVGQSPAFDESVIRNRG